MDAITGLKSNLGRVYNRPNLTFNLSNIGKIWQSELAPLNHPIKINILWFKPIYDIEHLNFQSALDFDLIWPSTLARSVHSFAILNIDREYSSGILAPSQLISIQNLTCFFEVFPILLETIKVAIEKWNQAKFKLIPIEFLNRNQQWDWLKVDWSFRQESKHQWFNRSTTIYSV